jgi:hypothetical protein
MSLHGYFLLCCCQLFYTSPITYKIQSTPQARLYFPQRIFPNASQCCMLDLSYLSGKLDNGTWSYVNVSSPRNLLLDNHGYIVTVEFYSSELDRFDAHNLTMISQTSTGGFLAASVGFVNNAYFVGLDNGPIKVIDSDTLTALNTIAVSNIVRLFGIIFLDNGQTMVISSRDNSKIVFFHQADNTSVNYTFVHQQAVNYSGPYGLTVYNDSYFYAASYERKQVYCYSGNPYSSLWIETLFINASTIPNTGNGTFVTIDECGRY